MTVSPLAMLGQCPHEKNYPLQCPYSADGDEERCAKCFATQSQDGDHAAEIVDWYEKAIEHLPESSKETFRFYTRNIKR